MGEVAGSSGANIVINARHAFTDELGIPSVPSGADLTAPLRIGIAGNGNFVYTTAEGEVRELAPFDLSQLDSLFPAVYAAPTASLSSVGTLIGEVGQSVAIQLAVAFNKNDAGEPTAIQILRDGNVIDGDASFTDNVVLVATPYVYQGKVLYGAGNVKKNPLGNFYPIGQIQEGSVNTNQIVARGYYFVGYGSVASVPANSAEARALTGRLSNNVSKFNLMASTTRQVIIVSPDMELVSVVDLDALNIDLFSQYALVNSNFSVNNAAGNPVSGYKVYAREQGIPYTTPHRHEVTLKRI